MLRIKKEWGEMLERGIMQMFEYEVYSLEDEENNYLLVNISIDNNGNLQHDFSLDFPFETEVDMSLDYNLEGLSEALTTDRNFTELYEYGHR